MLSYGYGNWVLDLGAYGLVSKVWQQICLMCIEREK